MTTKSDFAQKLLHDLRLRKERMGAAQSTSRQSSQTSRGKILAFLNPKFREPLTRESRNGSNKMSTSTNNTPQIRESKMVNTERNPQRKELKISVVAVEAAADPKLATIVMDNQRSHTSAANKVNGLKDSGNRRSRPSEKVPVKAPPNTTHQDAALMIDISQKTASDQENFKKEDRTDNSSTREPEIDNGCSNPLLMKVKPIEVSATPQRSIPKKVQRKEIPQKIDVLIILYFAGAHEESKERYNLSQHEYNKCPVSFLHAGDHNNEVAETKLIVDCAYEVMKRKARRHDHPKRCCMITSSTSPGSSKFITNE